MKYMSEIALTSNSITIRADALSTEAITISADNIKVGTTYYTGNYFITGAISHPEYHENFLFECEYCGCFDNKPGNCKHCGAPLKIYRRR